MNFKENHGTITVYPEKTEMIAGLIVFVVNFFLGLYLIWEDEIPFFGWIITIMFFLLSLIYIYILILNPIYLKLRKNGLEISTLFTKKHIKWSDINTIKESIVFRSKFVLISTNNGSYNVPAIYKDSHKLVDLLNKWKNNKTV